MHFVRSQVSRQSGANAMQHGIARSEHADPATARGKNGGQSCIEWFWPWSGLAAHKRCGQSEMALSAKDKLRAFDHALRRLAKAA